MTLANRLSLFRILSVPFFVGTLIYYNSQRDYLRWIALIIFCLAALSDLLDGFVARKLNQKNTFGAIIDPLADKVLLIAAFITVASLKSSIGEFRLPAWVPIIVISRDAIILLGVALLYTIKKEFEILPTPLGKSTTFFQMLTIAAILAHFNTAHLILILAVIFTVASGIQYIANGIKLMNEVDKNCS